ncbi:hypothetical protein Xhom_02610 [Xenorhabdus hominickii]|uniref:Uncharacterized protein n=1 Tax=Xenorhabdus hominickii TaxID=351679 RepID=A0A2G0Q610_XENHO|nr:hypothetical protein Xhom_02610 [Xenorhabdus hominickii]
MGFGKGKKGITQCSPVDVRTHTGPLDGALGESA